MPTLITFDNVLEIIKRRTNYDNSTGCWLYDWSVNDTGYGVITINAKKYKVHRVSASIYLGLNISDENIMTLHKPICPNTNCWNYEHLYLGNQIENMNDLKITGESVKTHCKNGHEYTPENTEIHMNKRRCIICKQQRQEKRNQVYQTVISQRKRTNYNAND